jgi:hypothetical protein
MDVYEEGIRSGYEGARIGFGGFGIDAYKKGQKVDPSVQAAYNLNKTLEKYPEFSKDARTEIQNEFVTFPDIAFINLEALASVLNFLKIYPNPTPEQFRDNIIIEYFTRLMPDKPLSNDDRSRLILRLKAQFIKYIVAIKNFREMRDEEYDQRNGEQQKQQGQERQQGNDEDQDEENPGDKYGEEEYEQDDE